MNTVESTQEPVVQNNAPSQGNHQFLGIDIRSTRITVDDIVSDAQAMVNLWRVKPDYAQPVLVVEKGKELTPSQKHILGVYINVGQLYL